MFENMNFCRNEYLAKHNAQAADWGRLGHIPCLHPDKNEILPFSWRHAAFLLYPREYVHAHVAQRVK
jgi:hypothetical protein